MNKEFSAVLSSLRHECRRNQRQTAADLGISQALLSHYENGLREPGLDFICRVCEYYGVSSDYMLGRTNFKQSLPLKNERGMGEAGQYVDGLLNCLRKIEYEVEHIGKSEQD